ncbi:MAG: hypothetical protein AAB516_01675 [Patescibacteria group bacterium]|mgnify:CR=1 FL=1
MNWKEFFKPNKSKIYLTLLLLLVLPVFWINYGSPFCDAIGGCPGSYSVHVPIVKILNPSGACSNFLDYILDLLYPIPALISDKNSCESIDFNTFYFNIIVAYLLVSIYNTKFKKA